MKQTANLGLKLLVGHASQLLVVYKSFTAFDNVYDADEERPTLPIYLDFDNLIESLGIEEKSDELVTAIRPYGSDELSMRNVNPIGTNWIYDLSYFIANGDIREPLASKWVSWQRSILNRQAYYRGLTGLRASSTARLLTAQATLADLKGELETLTAQQSVTIQAHAMEITSAGKAYQQSLLDDINKKIAAKTNEVKEQESTIASIERELDPSIPSSYAGQIQAIAKELSITNYFTEAEYRELSNFLIEQDITEDTFVATDVDTTISGQSYPLSGNRLTVSGSAISGIDLTAQFGKRMYTMSGGAFTLSGSNAISGDIIRGTLEVSDSKYVLSFYAGTLRVNDKTAASGMVTMSGTLSGFSTDVRPTTTRYPTDLGEDIYITTDEGSSLNFNASGALYLTANVSDYQRYSVEMELDSLTAGGAIGLTAVDASVILGFDESGTTIGVQVSKEEGNALELKDDGLFVPAAAVSGAVEFAIEAQETPEEGYAATYKLKRTEGEDVTYVGDAINIPKDAVLTGGTYEIVETADEPYEGAEVGDPYVDLVVANAEESHIYVPLKGLVDTVKAGDGIVVENNTVSIKLDEANANGLVVGEDGLSLAVATATTAGAMSAEDKAALKDCLLRNALSPSPWPMKRNNGY